MRISDLAIELKITEDKILAKLKTLKLKAKGETQELNIVVESVLRDEFAKEGIVSSKKRVDLDDDDDVKKKPKSSKVKKSVPETAKKSKTVKSKEEKTAKASKTKEKPAKETAVSSKADKAKTKDIAVQPEVKKEAPVEIKSIKKVVEEPKPVVLPVVEKSKEIPSAVIKPVSEPVVPKLAVQTSVVSHVVTAPASNIPLAKRKVTKSLEPFVTVKPLLKKRRRPMGPESGHGAHGSQRGDSRGEASVAQDLPVLPVADGPLVDIEIKVPISVKDLSVRLNQKTSTILKQLMSIGIFANINQNLGEDIVRKLSQDFGFNLLLIKTQEEQLVQDHMKEQENPDLLKPRAPVVTFMGHVDHGKTSLLDRIRSAAVADKEHGGITQHIGAYSVTLPKGTITFLDTPGHEAFTAMRARGAHITDLVVLVVAADEGIMPQTEEAIDHARAANVPIIVALNKIDRKNSDPEKVKKQLADHDLLPEDWGGKTIVVGVSAVTGAGIGDLLDMILLEAEVLELKANYDKKASGIVVESHLSRGRGSIATLIVQGGVLREGQFVVVGPHYGKIKAMFSDLGKPIKEAGPSMPVEVLGLSEVPDAGELFYVIEDEKQARDITFVRSEKLKEQRLGAQTRITLEDISTNIQQGVVKELNVILKADVHGSLGAVRDSLLKIPSDEVKVKFIHAAVGDVNMSDVLLAKASNAIILAFNVSVDAKAREEVENTGVDVRKYRIIYDAVNDLRLALEGMLAPKLKRKFLGRVEIRQVMKITKSGIVAGCYVQKGKVKSRAAIEIMRNGEIAFTGTIGSLKRFKDDVKEVGEGFECGITIGNYTAIEVGDIIEAFEVEEIARKL
jgi:translation initiation factor IF-2